jgi:hypothetical protein
MDSHLIYAAANSLKYKVTWLPVTPDSEWKTFKVENDSDNDFLIKEITEYFGEFILYFVYTRSESYEIDMNEPGKLLRFIKINASFFLWNLKFKSVIEFNHIGVMRKGLIH